MKCSRIFFVFSCNSNLTTTIVFFLDDGPGKMSSLESVLPSVLLAVQTAAASYQSLDWDILVGDTQCNSTIGPLTAVDMVYKYKPNLFLGRPNVQYM